MFSIKRISAIGAICRVVRCTAAAPCALLDLAGVCFGRVCVLIGAVIVFKAAVTELFVAVPVVGRPAFGADDNIIILEKIAFANRALSPFQLKTQLADSFQL